MIDATELSGKLAFDANSLNKLKASAKDNSPESIKAVAKQFEAVFINMVMKSMRAASPQDSVFDNEQSRTFTAMLDQQLSNDLANRGVGLADILARQLSKASGNGLSAMEQAVSGDNNTQKVTPTGINPHMPSLLKGAGYTAPISNTPTTTTVPKVETPSHLTGHVATFHQRLAGHAAKASQETGMPANYMLGQAALETGWGRREITGRDGTNSYNLFGIKATGGWKGKTVDIMTTEYINGVKQKRVEKFRAYDSYAESFKDFANLIQNNPRYQSVVNNIDSVRGYARAMQDSGYATDPKYANKLASVINKLTA